MEILTVHENGVAKRKRDFELIGGHAALDLVNTLDWRFRESGSEELLEHYSDVVRFIKECGLITAAESRRMLRDHQPRRSPQHRERRLQLPLALPAAAGFRIVEQRRLAHGVSRR